MLSPDTTTTAAMTPAPATITTSTPVHAAATMALEADVTIQVVTEQAEAVVKPALQRALKWFTTVEHACSRFVPDSEVGGLLHRVGEPVQVSPVLFEALRFALSVARATGGLYDPTTAATFRDVRLGSGRRVTLGRPMLLDLSGVATGLAMDLAACEVSAFERFRIEATDHVATRVSVADGAVCTRSDHQPVEQLPNLASVTVMAATAMAADGLATAAAMLGLEAGKRLLTQSGADGVFLTACGDIHRTSTRG
jgi:thiamine biosynthesis lipoprotein